MSRNQNKNCFDIQIVEKLLNGNKIKGYSDIVKDYTGLRLNKAKQIQTG